jgi:serine/threonine protein kinase
VHPIKCFNENNFYIFMDYCEDGTLQPLKDNPALLPEDKLINIFYQLLRGYEQLWRKGILHHDLKLANVLIRKGTLKITDFGFAIFGEKYIPSLTRQGTLQYMPYEKLTSVEYKPDEKTDIYSLGVMMF